MHDAFFQTRAARDRTGDTGHRILAVCTSHDAIFPNARALRAISDGRRPQTLLVLVLVHLCLCFGCVLCFVFCVFWPFWAESVFCVFVFWPCWGGLCFVFSCFGAAGHEISTSTLQISAPCKQTIYKQTGWRGAPELSNGAGWRQRAQAMAAKQCRLRAAGGKKF